MYSFLTAIRRLEFTGVLAIARLLGLWIAGLFLLLLLAFFVSLSAPWLTRVPAAIQVACIALLLLSLAFLRLMFRERSLAMQAMDNFVSAFQDLQILKRQTIQQGLTQEAMDALQRRGRSLQGYPKAWWSRLEQSFEFYEAGGSNGWFLTQPLQETLSVDIVTAPLYHFSFHQAVPGMLTAAGLLCTFAAILLGLSGVTYSSADPNHPITGIENLINGLSGKFLTSIVALVMSIVFIYCEKRFCERVLDEAHEAMLGRCRAMFPYLSQTRILLDIQAQLGRLNGKPAISAPGQI